jgi:hypothetical protein
VPRRPAVNFGSRREAGREKGHADRSSYFRDSFGKNCSLVAALTVLNGADG